MMKLTPEGEFLEAGLGGELLVQGRQLILHRGLRTAEYVQYNSPEAVQAALVFGRRYGCWGVEIDVFRENSGEVLLGHPGQRPQGSFAEILPLFNKDDGLEALVLKIDVKLPPQQEEAEDFINSVLSQLEGNVEIPEAVITLGRWVGEERADDKQMPYELYLARQIEDRGLFPRVTMSVELAKYGAASLEVIEGHLEHLQSQLTLKKDRIIRMLSVEIGTTREEWRESAELGRKFGIGELVFWARMDNDGIGPFAQLSGQRRREVLCEAIELGEEHGFSPVIFDMDPRWLLRFFPQ